MNFLSVSGVSVQQQAFALQQISFSQKAFQNIAITGETGAGKSTLMKAIAGLLQPDAGEIWFQGNKVLGPNDKLIPGHPGIAYLSQRFELRNHYRMEELMTYANNLTDETAQKIFGLCRIAHLLKRKTEGLSGGEQQRLALARLLLTSPRLLLLDEPFSNLDLIHKNILKQVIADIGTELSMSCILTSHDPLDVLSWADEIIVMKDGRIVQQDSPGHVYHHPATAYVAGLFGICNFITPAMASALSDASFQRLDDGQRLMIRPEHLGIGNDKPGITARIVALHFMGSYYIIEAKAHNENLRIAAMNTACSPGDEVYLHANAQHIVTVQP